MPALYLSGNRESFPVLLLSHLLSDLSMQLCSTLSVILSVEILWLSATENDSALLKQRGI